MKPYLIVLALAAFIVNSGFSQGSYTSVNNYTGDWENAASWTKEFVWMVDPPPSTSLSGSYVANIYGYITRNGDLTVTGGATLNVYDTLVVEGNLTLDRPVVIHPGGLLIVLGNLSSTGSGGNKVINNGDVVVVGEFSHLEGTISGGTDFYIFDDTPTIDPFGTTFPGTTEDEDDLYANDPALGNFLDNLGVSCGGVNTIGSAQTTCSAVAPATLTGSSVSGATYLWQSSTVSASSGFVTASGTSGNQNYSPGILTQTTWYRRRITKGACSATSAAIQITVFNGSVWSGTSSSAWGTAGNWCGGVPTTITDAVIPVVSTNYPSVSSASNCRDLTILSGASATISSNTLNVYGDFDNSGTLTVNGTVSFVSAAAQTISNTGVISATGNNNSLLSFNGSAQQTLSSTSAITTNNLTISNASSSQVVFQADVNVNRILTMTAGVVNLSGTTIKLGTSSANGVGGVGTLTAGTARFINGSFERWIRNATVAEGSAFLFPMGSATETRPIAIWTTAAPGTGSLIVSHTDNNTTTTGLSIADGGTINRRQNSYWSISAGNSLAGGTYSFKAGGTGFGTVTNLAHLRLMRLNNVTGTNALATGSFTDFLARRTGVTLANLQSNFYIGSINDASPLPIKLLYFTAEQTHEGITLDWATSMEKNFDHFLLEHATSELEFTAIANISGIGGLNIKTAYSFLDLKPSPGKNYYRLKSIDLDNTFEYSDVIAADWTGGNDGIHIYPNPVTNHAFTMDLNDDMNLPVAISVLEVRGYEVYSAQVTSSGATVTLPDSLSPGIYFVKVSSSNGQKTIRIVLDK